MKMLRLSLIASIAVAVAACSGGGSGSKSSVVSSSTGSSSGSGSTQPVNPNPPAKTAEYQGLKATQVSNNFTSVSHSQPNKLVVDGADLSLLPSDWAGLGGNTVIQTGILDTSTGVLGNNLSDAKYGFVQRDKSVFFIGKQTQDMPQTGKAVYSGLAIIDSPSKQVYDPDWKSRFEVDFGAKEVVGVLNNETSLLRLQANIDGAKFKGSLNGVYTEGAFFGKGASELSGVFSSERDGFIGVYGAKKSN